MRTALRIPPTAAEDFPEGADDSVEIQLRDARTERQALAERALLNLRAAGQAEPADRAALERETIASHLWLADCLARRFDHRGEELDDLVQVARAGLVEAVRRFDPDQGSFLAFAVPTISGVLKRHFRDHGWLVRPPRRTQELAAEVRQQWPQLVQNLRSDPSDDDVAQTLGESVSAVREASLASQCYSSKSLDATYPGGIALASDDAEADLERCEARIMLSQAWGQLTAEERRLLRMRFFEDRSQSDIAARIGTSQMQVSRLLARTLHRLRTIIGADEPTPLAS